MPADPSGVTTDEQAAQADGGDSAAAPAVPNGHGATGAAPGIADGSATAESGLPPVSGGAGRAPRSSGPVPGAPTIDPPGGFRTPSPEPPPAPVLEPAGGTAPSARPDLLASARRRVRGQHASRKASRRDRASRRGLRVDQRLWSIDPWSVFKISALFYFCLGLIILVAGTLLYNAGRSVGTIDQFESFVTRMGAYGECVPTAEVPEGTEFETDAEVCDEGQVLVGGFTLDDGLLFRAAAIGGTILVVAGSIGNVLLTVLINLLNEMTGGLRHTVIREPVQRQSGPPRGPGEGGARGPTRARRPAEPTGVAPPRSGSPGGPPQG